MKKLCLCLCTIILTTTLVAQEKQKEVSINLGSSNSYGISYRSGTAKSLWRFNLLSGNIGISNSQNEEETEFLNGQDNEIDNWKHENISYGIGVSIGKEFRNTITNKVEFRYGFDIGLNYNNGTNESEGNYNNLNNLYFYKSKYTSYTSSVNGILGFNYLLNKNLALGIEVLPRISYRITKNTGSRTYENNIDIEEVIIDSSSSYFTFDLNNHSARLSIAYRF